MGEQLDMGFPPEARRALLENSRRPYEVSAQDVLKLGATIEEIAELIPVSDGLRAHLDSVFDAVTDLYRKQLPIDQIASRTGLERAEVTVILGQTVFSGNVANE